MAVKTKVIPATSKDVRRWFAENPDQVPAGAEKSVQTSCKGRISTGAVEVFNKAHKGTMKYDETSKVRKVTPLTYKAKNHREVTVVLPTPQVRALAGKAGTRGPLSKKDINFATEMYLASH